MQTQPLISIIVPGYNCGAVVHRLLDSVLAQTWQNIELIFVNDGSTDQTAQVLEGYRERFAQRGISFIVITQQNQGVGCALQAGLKEFRGQYLCWADSDDYLEPDSLEIRATYLEQHPEHGCVTGQAIVRNVPELEQVGLFGKNVAFESAPNHFEQLLQRNSIFCAGCHMLRASDFLKINPERKIYPSRHGQNWQMLLPMYYHYSSGFIAAPVYNYLLWPNSLSREILNVQKRLDQISGFKTILDQTLDSIRIHDPAYRKKCERIVLYDYCSDLLFLARDYKAPQYAKQARTILKENGLYDARQKRLYREATNPLAKVLMGAFRRMRDSKR